VPGETVHLLCTAGASRNSRLPASVEMVEPLRRAAIAGELLDL